MTDHARYRKTLEDAIKAVHDRGFYAAYPEHPKAYDEDAHKQGRAAFEGRLNHQYDELMQPDPSKWAGEERSPFTDDNLGIAYPLFAVDDLMARASQAWPAWRKASAEQRALILVEALDRITHRFFEIAYATMHTTGQSYMMSFQASGPHANDRALEAVALGYHEQMRFPEAVTWTKPMGKFDITLEKSFKPVPRGIGLVIGCSTFPVWNTVPGMFASLVTGNPVIVKPHPGAVLPIAIVISEVQQALHAHGFDPHIVQMAADVNAELITKDLATHNAVKLIDYTGGPGFGEYIEGLPGKISFTEKAGVNTVILDSVVELKPVVQNLAFAISLYSGQMCTAPQNIFIPKDGVREGDQLIPYSEVVEHLKHALKGLAEHPKMGAGTLGAIQNPGTIDRVKASGNLGAKVALESPEVENEEFSKARVLAPTLMETSAADTEIYSRELFGPAAMIIQTDDTQQSIDCARDLAISHGAITCALYTTDADVEARACEEMEKAFTPVSINLTGFIWVNQHAAFSDFHVTGGNPAGNASFTNPEYVNKRFVWVGHRKMA